MLRDLVEFIEKLQSVFVDDESVEAHRSMIPRTVDVNIRRDGEGYIATVVSIDKHDVNGILITQSNNYDGLIKSVNDLIYSYSKIPAKIRPRYGNVLRPTQKKQTGELELLRA